MDFEKVIKTNKQNIKSIVRLITKEENEDIEQEVYLKIWKNSEKYNEKGSIKSWISSIAKNASLDYLKSSYHKVFQTSTSDDFVIESIKDKNGPIPKGYIITAYDFAFAFPNEFPIIKDETILNKYIKKYDTEIKRRGYNLCDTPDFWLKYMEE